VTARLKKIPLRDSRAGLLPPKGNLQECNFAFIALRGEPIAECRSNELEGLRLLPNAKKVDLLRGVQRRARLHRSEFSGEQRKRVRHRHAEARLRDSVE